MNRSVFWRLVWKEYRLQRALWISMAVLTVLVQLLVLVFVQPGVDRITYIFAIGLGFPAFYALGCGATLFATEHETGTYGFQRALPVSALRLFGGKVALACISTIALIGLLWLLSAILAGWQFPREGDNLVIWGLWGLAAVELLVWGIFFSLLCTRPLLAAILAVTAASLSVHVVAGGPGPHLGGQPYLEAVPFRVGIAGLVALADVWLGCRWFRERIVAADRVGKFRRGEPTGNETAAVRPGVLPARTAILGRLVWQQWRQSASIMASLGALLVPLILAGVWVWMTPAHIRQERLSVAMILAAVMACLLGASVFLGDQQRRRFRFFAEQGVRPRYVWLSRQVICIMPVLLLTAAVLPLFLFGNDDLFYAWGRGLREGAYWRSDVPETGILLGDSSQVAMLFGCVGLAYASGQLCSMLLRSGVLAAVFGLVLTAVLCGWASLMVALGVNLGWSLAPIPLVLLLATWLRAPDWILERNSLRAWFRVGVSLLVPAAVLLTAVPLYRVHQIAEVSPGFSPEAYARPITAEQRATVEMYQRASDLRVPWKYDEPAETEEARKKKENAWLTANREAIAVALKASQREDCSFFASTLDAYERNMERASNLGPLLSRSAGQLQSEGKLDAALKRYLAALRVSVHLRRGTLWPGDADALEANVYGHLPGWAAHADQTPERIRGAILKLDEFNKSLPPRSDAIKSQYLLMRRIISADPEALAYIEMGQNRIFKTTLWGKLLPWEKSRAVRVLNVRTARDLRVWNVEDPVKHGRHVRYPYHLSVSREPPYPFFLDISRYCEGRSGDVLAGGLTRMETRRRAVRLLLALQAWKVEHGKLPTALDELVGPYLKHLPLHPYTFSEEPFRFFREGLPIPLTDPVYSWIFPRPLPAEAGTPLIWSTGPNVYVRGTELAEGEEEYVRYEINKRWEGGLRWPTNEYDVWASGWWFPLP